MKEDREKALKERMVKERGFVGRAYSFILVEKDPELAENFHEAAMHVFHKRKALPLKFKEIIAVCMDAITFYPEGFRTHAAQALKAGATEDEIIEALEVCTLLGKHYLYYLPALEEEVKSYKKQQASAAKKRR